MLALQDRSKLLFFSYDLAFSRFTYTNPAFRTFFDISSRELDYHQLLTLVHSEDRSYIENSFKELLSGKELPVLECRFIDRDHQRWLRINAYLVKENDVNAIMGHAEDISIDHKHSEVLNSHSNKKNSILNILTHDLAGPIGTIGNLSELLKRETINLENHKVNEYISLVRKISKNCLHLIREFMNQEFLESVGVKLLKKRVELVERVTTITEEYLKLQKDLKLHFKCNANREKIYIEIDEDKFLQVINNLVSNSMKFTPDGGTISVYMEEREHSVLLSVADTGIGIPEKYHATLFDKFNDARRSGLKGEHSTGLGMSIIKTIVEWHKGSIWFESETNKGSTFYIELPK
jgi:two-component system sensor histidine kinase VicK